MIGKKIIIEINIIFKCIVINDRELITAVNISDFREFKHFIIQDVR